MKVPFCDRNVKDEINLSAFCLKELQEPGGVVIHSDEDKS